MSQAFTTVCHNWKDANVLWEEANWTWEECQIVASFVGTIIEPRSWEQEQYPITPWNPYKNLEQKKKLVEILCKINGQEFNEKINIEEIKITVNDARLMAKEVLGIELDVSKLKINY